MRRSSPLLVLVLALGLHGALDSTAEAQRPPTARAQRTVRASGVIRRENWEEHQPFFAHVDRMLSGLHGKATRKGFTPDKLNTMSPIQLTGSGVYGVSASLRKNTLPKFDDIDLRMIGVTASEVRAAIIAEFPEAADTITIEPAYLPGLVHMQADIGPRQLDISIYPSKKAYLAPHQRLSIAALKHNVDPSSPLLPTLRGMANSSMAREQRAKRIIADPAGTGIEDAEDGIVRTYKQPGMDPKRAPEGLLHAAYWSGKTGDGLRLDPATATEFANMSRGDFGTFFGIKDPEIATARRNYVFSVLRAKPGRNPGEVLKFLRTTGALGKILPGMDEVVASKDAWKATELVTTRAHAAVLHASGGSDPRWGREVMLAAMLSGLEPGKKASGALAGFHWNPKDQSPEEFSRERVLDLQGKFAVVSRRYEQRMDVAARVTPASAKAKKLKSQARIELNRGIARIVTDQARTLTGGPVPVGAWARSSSAVGNEGPFGQLRTPAAP